MVGFALQCAYALAGLYWALRDTFYTEQCLVGSLAIIHAILDATYTMYVATYVNVPIVMLSDCSIVGSIIASFDTATRRLMLA